MIGAYCWDSHPVLLKRHYTAVYAILFIATIGGSLESPFAKVSVDYLGLAIDFSMVVP